MGSRSLSGENVRNIFWLSAVVILSAGCGTPGPAPVPEKVSGRPPAYQDGYRDGCTSGKAEASHSRLGETKDIKRFQSDQNYAVGWYEGSESCRDSYRPSTNDARHDPTKPVRVEGGW